MIIQRINSQEYHLVIDLFNKYRVFYQQLSDMALAERFIKDRLQNNESVIFVAINDNHGDMTPVGFTQLYPIFSSARATKNWLLNDLYVEKDYRKNGIGEALIKTAMHFAQKENATFVKLETAFDNYPAQRLYESIGFEKQVPNNNFFVYKINLTS